jgi:hypothetical protein
MGVECSTNGEKSNVYRFYVFWKARGMILRWILERQDGAIDWIVLAQDMDKWRALVNAVMNLRVRCNAERFLIGCKTGGLHKSSAPYS